MIKCISGQTTPCSKVNNVNTCNKAGCVKVDDINDPTSATLCLTSGCSDDDNNRIIITSNGNDIYKSISISSKNDFPGAEVGSASIKVGSDGVAILLEDTALPSCTSIASNNACFTDAVNEQYCINTDNKIYKTSINGSQKSCSLLNGKTGTVPVYFNNVFNEVNAPTEASNNIIAYLCSFNDSQNVESCELMKGYAINNSKYIQCSGWKREGCKVVQLNTINKKYCSENEGVFGINPSSNNVLCFGTNEYIISSVFSGDTISFKTSNINPFYSSLSEKVVFLSVIKDTSYSYIISTKSSGN